MKIIHYTSLDSMRDIMHNGFMKNIEPSETTQRINVCLESLKPSNLPSFVRLDDSVQFLPADSIYTPFKVAPQGINELRCLQVDTKRLNSKKLYVVNGIYAGRINNLLTNCYRSDNVEECLRNMVNTSYYKETIKKYWKSFTNYNLYCAKNKVHLTNENEENTVLLYFDDISPSLVNEIQFNKQYFLRRQQLN